MRRQIWLSVSFLLPLLHDAAAARDVTLCAASSLREPLQVVSSLFEQEHRTVSVRLHCAGSTALRRQIEVGGPCDVFVAAGTDDIDSLNLGGFIHTSHPLAGNRLVLFSRKAACRWRDWTDLQHRRPTRLAIGDPHTAPVGRYALQAISAAGLMHRFDLVPCADALHVVTSVASGAAEAGLAYRTDVRGDERLQECAAVPDSLFSPVTYTLALLSRGAETPGASQLVEFARGRTARAVLESFGFTAPPIGASTAAAMVSVPTPWTPRTWHPLWLSLRVAGLATLIAGGIGLALAARLARARPSWSRDLLAACADLPLVLPPSVLGLVLLQLCGPQGFLGSPLQRFDIQIAFTWGGAVLASSIVALPLMVRPARSALEAVPRRYVQAARTLGATPWRAFWRVEMPLARRGIFAGGLLAFFRALGEFGATLMVAGNIPGKTQTVPLAIYDAVFLGQTREAAVWVLGVMFLTFTGAVVAQRLHGGAS